MAEAIAGLSLAANVAQFVIAGVSVARFLHDVYQSSSGLTKHHEQLLLVAKNFKEASGNISKQGNVAWDSDLARLMRECREVAKELSDDLESLKRRSSKSDRSQKVWMTVRAVWKRGRIEELSERLEKLTKPVALQLLRKAQYVFSSNSPIDLFPLNCVGAVGLQTLTLCLAQTLVSGE